MLNHAAAKLYRSVLGYSISAAVAAMIFQLLASTIYIYIFARAHPRTENVSAQINLAIPFSRKSMNDIETVHLIQ